MLSHHPVPIGSSLAFLPRPSYSSSLLPPPPPKPPPLPRPRLARVCASWIVMFGRQGLGRANHYSQLSLPLVASSDHPTTVSLQCGEFPSWLAPIGATVRAAGVSASHNQAEKRCRDGINALWRRSPLSPLTFTRLVTLKDFSLSGPDAPLYLEWAPSNILSQSSTSKNNEINGAIGENEAKRQILEQQVERIIDVDIDLDRAWSLFVKNLNFKTMDESPRKHLTEHMKEGSFLSVKGIVLDSQALILQPCNVKNDGQKQKTIEKDRNSTKLLIKNVAFEATEKNLIRST
ncbi:hypothetical protein JHK82_033490 [Glycine max]|nr:hypothetical protein JHK85_034211 [Glycine max]KAG5119070.1 hypothetical protein JHK82_033490 [Glycine max]KAG5140063.1 hypothetical protein JHK84_033831 [Glycine max]